MLSSGFSASLSAVRKVGDSARNELFGLARKLDTSAPDSAAQQATQDSDRAALLGTSASSASAGGDAMERHTSARRASGRKANPAEFIHIFVNQVCHARRANERVD